MLTPEEHYREASSDDMVAHPPHYTRGPRLMLHLSDRWSGQTIYHALECIEVIRHIPDMRLANAMKYIWRVAFGGKEHDRQDIEKARWYLQDWLDHPSSEEG
jgi:hypothetical protein